uniref:penicillin-binding transpeptidase domain-containing protein n=1 Tax=Candidatus Scatomorpha intestinigallinarum TaxID=2840923 RepID=UPI00402596A8
MKKVKRRATAALLIAALLVVGLAVYLVRLADDGGAWASYFSGGTPGGTILDRNGVVLYSSDEDGYSFAEDWSTRVSCYHLLGDPNGNVRTGALRQFRDRLAGYSFLEGATSGKTISLSVDSALNVTAYSALAGRNGAVMLMDYTTGEVLCMVSSPGDDPENPSSEPADGTYLNKCLSSSFTPGSVFKLVTLAAAIDNIPDLFERSLWCEGEMIVDGALLTCTGSHGSQTIEQALANSCNCAFGTLALELGPKLMAEYAEKLGMTASLQLDGMDVLPGSFTKGEAGSVGLAWSGVGQYEDLVCPYAMLRYVSAIANGGSVYEPTLLGHGSLDRETELLSAETAQRIAEMMNYNVQNAYGSWVFPGLDVSAKTGTAEVGDGTSHAWMTGFLNDPAHPYAFVVILEHAGGGLANAGPVANTVLQAAVSGSAS